MATLALEISKRMNTREMVCLNEQIEATYDPIFRVIEEERRQKGGRNGNLTKNRTEVRRFVNNLVVISTLIILNCNICK